jgi:hypothetical protein
VVFPDVLVFAEGTKRLLTTVEVETGESVNPIEARAEWGVYSKLKVPLHLYVPTACVEAAKRISDEYQIVVSELWSYMTSFDQVRFTLVSRSPDAPTVKLPAARPELPAGAKSPRPQPKGEPGRAAKPAAAAKPKPAAAKPAAKPKPAARAKAKPTAKPAAKKSKPAAKPKAKAAKKVKKR